MALREAAAGRLRVARAVVHLDGLVAGAGRHALAVIVVDDVMDDVLVLRSNHLRLEHAGGCMEIVAGIKRIGIKTRTLIEDWCTWFFL